MPNIISIFFIGQMVNIPSYSLTLLFVDKRLPWKGGYSTILLGKKLSPFDRATGRSSGLANAIGRPCHVTLQKRNHNTADCEWNEFRFCLTDWDMPFQELNFACDWSSKKKMITAIYIARSRGHGLGQGVSRYHRSTTENYVTVCGL